MGRLRRRRQLRFGDRGGGRWLLILFYVCGRGRLRRLFRLISLVSGGLLMVDLGKRYDRNIDFSK